MEANQTPTLPNSAGPPARIPHNLLGEIADFQAMCHQRYQFNSRWDNIMNVAGIAVSLGIVACGVYKQSELAAMLGGLVTAVVTAQRAFPFNQRWQFYRVLDSEAANLVTEVKNGTVTPDQTITMLKAMRLDFARQIPRGSSFRPDSPADGDGDSGASSQGDKTD